MKRFAVKFRRILELLCLWVLQRKLLAQFHDLCAQKLSCLLWNSDVLWKLSARKFYRKSSGRNSTISVSINEAVSCEVQTHFGSFRLSSFIKKVAGAFSRFLRPKMKLFAVKFRRILELLCLWVLQRKLLAQFHDLCAQKLSCLLWNSDVLWKLSAKKFYRKSFGRNSTISVSINEAVSCEVQTHFGSFRLSSFIKKLLGAFSQFIRPKMKLFAVNFRSILDIFAFQAL